MMTINRRSQSRKFVTAFTGAGLVHFMRCPNVACKRPFKISRFNAQLSGLSSFGKINCPHCAMMISAHTDSLYLADVLSVEEEATFTSWRPKKKESA